MNKRKWAILAGAIAGAVVLLVGLGFGVSTLFAQEPEPTPVPEPSCPPGCRPERPAVEAARFGWQVRGQVELVAEVLGMSPEDLVAELREGKSVTDVAAEKGVALETVVEALLDARREALAEAVAAGRLTQEEADEMLAEMEERITERLQQSGLPMGPAGRMGQAARFGWQARGQVELVAEALGMDTEDLVAELGEGKSVADVAAERGVALETVVEALLDARREALAEAVAAGRLTQEEADQRLAEMEERITEHLQQVNPVRRMWTTGRGAWGGRGPGLMGRGQRGGRGGWSGGTQP